MVSRALAHVEVEMVENDGDRLQADLFVNTVITEASRNAEEFDALVHEQEHIEAKLATLRERQAGLNSVLNTYGHAPIGLHEPGSPSFAQPGNRSQAMPLRKEQWQNVSLPVATKAILDQRPAIIFDTNAVVDVVYEITSEEERRAAKRSLRSTLIRGVKDGAWDGPAPGRYRSKLGSQAALESVR